MAFYLDHDTTPPTMSSYVYAKIDRAINAALARLNAVEQGQIGIYKSSMGGGFKGYAIKYPNGEPYFEPNLDEAAA